MSRYDSSKKKVRGWKKHKRRIEQWKKDVIDLDMEIVREHHREYEKIYFYPFYQFEMKKPPSWYVQVWFSAIVDVYLAWHKKMKKGNEPFYLSIWLFNGFLPNKALSTEEIIELLRHEQSRPLNIRFNGTQIVTAYKESLTYYQQLFDKQAIQKEMPLYRYTKLKNTLELFHWDLHIDAYNYYEKEMKNDIQLGLMTEEEMKSIIANAYKTEKVTSYYGGEDVCYRINVGDVWVGTLKREVRGK